MLCEICKINNATYHSTVNINGNISQTHLCNDCFVRQNAAKQSAFGAPNIASFFDNNFFVNQEFATQPKKDVLVCKNCQTTFDEFVKNGFFTCASCYEAFYDKIIPILKSTHTDIVHVGKRLLEAKDGVAKKARDLEFKLKQAVAAENYELASQIKKQIIELKNEEASQ